MTATRPPYVAPSVTETAFNCPKCHALAKQVWSRAAAFHQSNRSLPDIVRDDNYPHKVVLSFPEGEGRDKAKRWADSLRSGLPFFTPEESSLGVRIVGNLNISQCFNCGSLAVWVYDRLVWPHLGEAPPANPDLPEDLRADYDEASTILDLSPRGASALLRLVLQKLCAEVGGKGQNIDEDIGKLVREGLPEIVQQAMDSVRVIGNGAVHPGKLDIRDDRATAEALFSLVNFICDQTISRRKQIEGIFAKLPERARAAIEKRDRGARQE